MSIDQVKSEVIDIIRYISAFYRNPFLNVKKIPSWSWLSLCVLIFIFSSITGLMRGVFSGNVLQSIIGFVFLPITAFIFVMTLSAIYYFLIVVFKNRNLNFKRLATLAFVATIPTITVYALSLLHPAFIILGITFTFLLFAFGLIHRFQVGKKFIWTCTGLIYGLILAVWLISYFNYDSGNRAQKFMNSKSSTSY